MNLTDQVQDIVTRWNRRLFELEHTIVREALFGG